MEAATFVIERTINAPVDKVWSAITNRDEMEEWYFNLSGFEPVVGFEFQFAGGTEEATYLHKCRVIAVVPPEKLTYSWCYNGFEGNSFVTFELAPYGENATRLKLTHEGLESFPPLADFSRTNFEEGWNYIIGESLVSYFDKKD